MAATCDDDVTCSGVSPTCNSGAASEEEQRENEAVQETPIVEGLFVLGREETSLGESFPFVFAPGIVWFS